MLSCILLWLFSPWVHASPAAHTNLVRQGVIDLSHWQMQESPRIALNGDWGFYWQQWLSPTDPALQQLPRTTTIVPQRNPLLTASGWGTYRLRIIPPPGQQQLALRLNGIWARYTLWIDGQLRASNQKNMANSQFSPLTGTDAFIRIVPFSTDGRPVELIIQVDCNTPIAGGLEKPILLGTYESMSAYQAQRWGIAMLVAGALLMMGLYHLAIFIFLRRRNHAAFFLGSYCLLRLCNALYSGGSDWAIWLITPQIGMQTAFMFGMSCLTISSAFLQAFFHLMLPKQFSKSGFYLLVLAGVGCLLFGLYDQYAEFSRSAFYLYALIISIYSVTGLIRASIAHEQGAYILLGGYLLLVMAAVNDILIAKNIIESVWLTPTGTLCFILSQSIVLARRFSQAFSLVEAISGRLEVQNQELQEEMRKRNQLEQKLAVISEEERCAISQTLHDGLCQELTAARLHCSLLQASGLSNPIQAAIRQLAALLEKAVDQAYELSRGLWPIEHEIHDLQQALTELAHKFQVQHQLAISMQYPEIPVQPTKQARAHLFYVAKEALQNVVKHAQAKQVWIRLDYYAERKTWQLSIEDDGIGLQAASPSAGQLGTRIMAHRAQAINGSVTLAERPEGGTQVHFCVPDSA